MAVYVAHPAVVNRNGTKMLVTVGVSTFSIDGKATLVKEN